MGAKKQQKARPGQELLDQLRVAGQQLDASAGGRLSWIVGFAREDPRNWLPADREAHGYRLLAFALGATDKAVPGTHWRPLAGPDVLSLHAELGDVLRAVVSGPGRMVKIPTEGLETALVRLSEPGEKPAIFGISHGGPLRTMLFQKLAGLVAGSDRLIACPGPKCGRPFLALRKMKFCTPKCAERWHDRQKIEKKQRGVGR